MRKALQQNSEQRLGFTAIFERYGSKAGRSGMTTTTLLLKNVRFENGEPATDHIWFSETKGFQDLAPLQKGQQLAFEATIAAYNKGYRGHGGQYLKPQQDDFKLSRPTKIKKL
ncbi:MAG: hypothetical protein QM731_06880 [Chitinophagaceae bacterium]